MTDATPPPPRNTEDRTHGTALDAALEKAFDAQRVLKESRMIRTNTPPESVTEEQSGLVLEAVKAYLKEKSVTQAQLAKALVVAPSLLASSQPAQVMPPAAQATISAVDGIALSMARTDFGYAVFQGMPQDAWVLKLGNDPAKWIDEALVIRKDWLAKMAAMGVNPTINNTPIHPVSIGASPQSNPLAALIAQAFKRFESEGVGGTGGTKGQYTTPSTAIADLNKSMLAAAVDAGAVIPDNPAAPKLNPTQLIAQGFTGQ